MLHAGAQGDAAGAGLDRVAHQVPHRLGEAVGVAVEFGNAGVVVALQAYCPAGLVLGQAQHALQRGMDVQFGMRRGRGRRQQLVEQTVEALDLRADQLDQLAFAGIALGRAAGQQLGRTLQTGQRVAQLVGQPLQRRAERAGQGLGGIEPRDLIARVRLQQPAAIIAAAHPALGEARRLAGHGQRQPVQAQAVALIAVQEMGQCLALHFQCGQGPTQQASRADAQPAGKGRIAAGNAAVGASPGQRRAQGIEGRRGCGVGHCTNVVQNTGSGSGRFPSGKGPDPCRRANKLVHYRICGRVTASC
ncbi:hypothetical protein G6F35_011798 [Rhizopus arrhizus]|nr:hypothetical protein G6F35_011798 [Rhizopus arrhizus]